MTVAAAYPGARGKSMRAFSLVLAALATGVPLFLLVLGLSIHTIRAIRDSQLSVDLIPLPPPPPPPEPVHPEPAKPSEHAAAPAPAAPKPATLVDQSAAILPQPVPQPASADISGSGTGTTPGTGTGGDGPGGNGSGPAGGAVMPVRIGASWIFKPGTAELRPYNPPRARAESVSGEVLLTCRVLRSQKVADCRVAAERPYGYGFGTAALQASRLFRLDPPTIDGAVDERRRVEIPVTFNNRR